MQSLWGKAGRGLCLTGDHNVGVGYKALYEGTSGTENTAVGTESLEKISTGSGNVAVGYFAGDAITTADSGVFIGANSGAITAGLITQSQLVKTLKQDQDPYLSG